jgi:exodeoxyribonuclease V gamma subunit
MGVHLVYANHTEELLAAFCRDLGAHRAGAGPLSPVRLVVPNRNIESFVKRGVARATGVAANIEARFLKGFAEDLVASHPDAVRLVDNRVAQGLVLSQLLDDAFLRELWAAPLRSYIFAAGDKDSIADLRRVQLSAQLARLFEEYAYSRPEMLEAWHRRAVLQHTGQAEVESWQRHLWLHVFGRGGLVDARAKASGERWLDLRRFVDETSPADLPLPPRLFVFGFSYFAPLFHKLLARLAERIDVHVYAFNPCREYWEDVRPDHDGDDPFGLDRDGDQPLLRLWGRPGREHVGLLNDVTGCDFTEGFVNPGGDGSSGPPPLLHALQRDILDRAPDRAEPPADLALAADPHIKVMACPSIARETEVIANRIWQLVAADDSLSMSDIAVIVNPREQDAYLAHLAAAFREANELPYHVVDAPLSTQSRLVEGIGMLLALPLGGFGRQELLGLLTHPVVLAEFPDVEPDEWLDACDDLGIVHGADAADHAQTYIRRDVFNWDQGLVRLALGAFMTGARSGDERTVELGGRRCVPEERGPGARASGARFGLLVRSLTADARFARGARMTLAEWTAFFAAFVTSYVHPEDEQDERDLLRCLARIHDIEALDLGDVEVSYRVAYELAWDAVSQLRGARGGHLGDGVVISAFTPMRAIPFRVVFVTGMGEGLFPAAAHKNHLDLRQTRRRAGDVNARERDKYAFLETLMCTRERLFLSYVARNALTGEELQPSSVVQELTHAIERGYLGAEWTAKLVEPHALRRFDEDTPATPAAGREARARELGRELRAAIGEVGDTPPANELRGMMPAKAWETLADRLGIVEAPEMPERTPGAVESVELSLAALRKFLECPLQGSARYVLRLWGDEEQDVLARENEPFGLTILEDIVFLREVFGEAMRRGARVRDVYDERAALRELCGRRPTAVFDEVLREVHSRDLACWKTLYDAIPGRTDGPFEPVRFGRAEEHADVYRIEDAIGLDVELPGGRRARVSLSGRTNEIAPGGSGSVVLAKRAQSNAWWAKSRNGRDWLRGFLDGVALAASGIKTCKSHATYLCVAAGGEPVASWVRFAGFSRDEARAYLSAVVGDLLSGVHPYLLPFEAVFRARRTYPGESIEAAVSKALGERGVTSKFGPVPGIERFAPPREDEALDMIARRLGPFFERIEVMGGAGEGE